MRTFHVQTTPQGDTVTIQADDMVPPDSALVFTNDVGQVCAAVARFEFAKDSETETAFTPAEES